MCDLALEVGADAPTLCEGWAVRDLVAHCLVRENSPVGAAGVVVPPLSGLTEWAMDRQARQGLPRMVKKLRDPGLTPFALPAVEKAMNSLEYFVHHEDIRRAQPGWEPRELRSSDQDKLWRLVTRAARGLLRKSEVPVTLRRADTAETAEVRPGTDPVTVTGLPAELVMFVFGRSETHGLSFDGPRAQVTRLRGADKGL